MQKGRHPQQLSFENGFHGNGLHKASTDLPCGGLLDSQTGALQLRPLAGSDRWPECLLSLAGSQAEHPWSNEGRCGLRQSCDGPAHQCRLPRKRRWQRQRPIGWQLEKTARVRSSSVVRIGGRSDCQDRLAWITAAGQWRIFTALSPFPPETEHLWNRQPFLTQLHRKLLLTQAGKARNGAEECRARERTKTPAQTILFAQERCNLLENDPSRSSP